MNRRLVLCPQGLPSRERDRELCCRFLLACGGDLLRVLEGDRRFLNRFVLHISRVRGIREGNEAPIALLMASHPLELEIVDARRVLQRAIPALASASWLIFVDPASDPFFGEAAQRIGAFDDELSRAPIWTESTGFRFLVLSPLIADAHIAASRLIDLDERVPLNSGAHGTAPPPPDYQTLVEHSQST